MTGLGIVKGMESKRKAVMAEAERLALAAVPNMSRIDSLNGMAAITTQALALCLCRLKLY